WKIIEAYLIYIDFNYDGSTTGNEIAKALAAHYGWCESRLDGAVGNIENCLSIFYKLIIDKKKAPAKVPSVIPALKTNL
ncbi:MAG TPA: hypothetical protein DDW27_14735, partial [Bacteroidales bacterium]|nr:hypothetical protein [Bacteroidales bacterium]